MKMESIFETISSTILKVEEEKEAAKKAANEKCVKKVIAGLKDVRAIIQNIFEKMATEESFRDLLKRGVVKTDILVNQKRYQKIIVERCPYGTTEVSELFDNDDVKKIEEAGNLKSMTTELYFKEIENLVLDSGDEATKGIRVRNSRNIEFLIDGKWFDVFIEDGIKFDRVGKITLEL
jgi:hypothetical protein